MPSLVLLWPLACAPDPWPGPGLLGEGGANPFPSAWHVQDGRLDLDLDALPVVGENPLPVERLGWRAGFSPAQTAVVRLDGVDPAALPGWRADGRPGAVRALDLEGGGWWPVMAELDAWPGAERPGLLVRPLQAWPVGHTVVVAVSTAAAPRPALFQRLLDGDVPEDLEPAAAQVAAEVAALAQAGLPEEELAFCWSFPVGDGTAPLRSALAQAAPTGAWTWREVKEAGEAVPRAWRSATGRYGVVDLLVDDRLLNLQDDGSVAPTGEAEAFLYVHIPESVQDAPAGSVPVVLFGHGIFSDPELYLGEPDDPSGVVALADEGGFILIATRWRGLTTTDAGGALEVARDFSNIPLLGDRLTQGLANHAALMALLLDGALLEDPVFAGASGQLLPQRGALSYYGISLGGIEGAVLASVDLPLDAAVLHVPGSTWSTMLERSSNWPLFEELLVESVEEPWDRQVLYSLSQLFWDPADPLLYAADLGAFTPALLQEAIGDEQVPNLSTRTLARSAGLTLLSPEAEAVWGLDTAPGPLPPGRSALVQFDPQRALPPDQNRPAPVTGAHTDPRLWPGQHSQTVAFLRGEGVQPGCGDAVCSAENTGD